ncbi:MAG: peptidylprolyl isomerase [Candidatus Hydrogenedentes bacterium]|nr:peptidylprolyl isomerase [Candidatus Hydrogenedentota bacterium]
MNRVVVLSAILALAAGLAGAQAPNLEQMDIVLKTVPDGPIAKVNGAVIPRTDFTDLYRSELKRQEAMKRSPLTDRERLELGVHCLGMIVENEIVYQEALKRKLKVSDEDVAKGWQAEVKLIQNQLGKDATTAPSEDELLKMAGVSKESAMEEVKKAQLIEKARAEIAKEKGVSVTDKEIAAFFEANKSRAGRADQMHMKQIFIRANKGRATGGLSPEKAREKAETALKSIKAGQSFEAVAKNMSDGKEKENGGDLGMRPVRALPPFLVDAASKLQPGDVSGVIESEYGFHVVKLVESVAGVDLTLEKASPEIKRILTAQKSDAIVREYCESYMKNPKTPEAVQVYLDLNKTLSLHPELKLSGE